MPLIYWSLLCWIGTSNDDHQILHKSGSDAGVSVTSSGSKMYVKFSSDYTTNNWGVEFGYVTFDLGKYS